MLAAEEALRAKLKGFGDFCCVGPNSRSPLNNTDNRCDEIALDIGVFPIPYQFSMYLRYKAPAFT